MKGVFLINLIIGISVLRTSYGKKTFEYAVKFVIPNDNLTLTCPDVNTSSSNQRDITWSRNGHNLRNWADELTYHMVNVHLNDDAVFICNNSGIVKSTSVIVGNKPMCPPPPRCNNSPNTTIVCQVTSGDDFNATVCLLLYTYSYGQIEYVADVCGRGNATAIFENTAKQFWTATNTTNVFGTTECPSTFVSKSTLVIPNPPMDLKLATIGLNTFTASYGLPSLWIADYPLYLRYQYNQSDHPPKTIEIPDKKRGINSTVQFTLTVSDEAYSLVCMKLQVKYMMKWSRFSETICEHTPTAAPSEAPKNFVAEVVQNISNPEKRMVTFSWEPPDKRHCNGIITRYTLTMSINNDESTLKPIGVDIIKSFNISGNETRMTRTTTIEMESYYSYDVILIAWTEAGSSPENILLLDPLHHSTTNNTLRVIWVIIVMWTIAFVLIFLTIMYGFVQTVRSQHLPEPYIIPSFKSERIIVTKWQQPLEKEVFDILKGRPASISSEDENRTNTTTITDDKIYTVMQNDDGTDDAFSGRDSGIYCEGLCNNSCCVPSCYGHPIGAVKMSNTLERPCQISTGSTLTLNTYVISSLDTIKENNFQCNLTDTLYGDKKKTNKPMGVIKDLDSNKIDITDDVNNPKCVNYSVVTENGYSRPNSSIYGFHNDYVPMGKTS